MSTRLVKEEYEVCSRCKHELIKHNDITGGGGPWYEACPFCWDEKSQVQRGYPVYAK